MSTTETLSIDLNQPHTYSCWVNLSSGYSTKFFMSFLSMYGPSIGHTNGGYLTFFSGNVNGQVGSGAILPLNTWSHVVVVFKGRTYGTGNVLFYVNGNLVSTTSLGFGNVIPTVPLTIGSRNVEGKLDECAIWSRELTASEVTELYNAGAGKQYVAPAPAVSYLLDTYGGASTAYSLRKLSSTYTGSAIRVRRSSDNAEQNIGFIGNDLDTTSLTSFVGAGNGFVTTWYDQSGSNKDMSQTTASNQPLIVESGVLITKNGKTTVKIVNNTHLTMSSGVGGSWTNFAFFAVYYKNTTANNVVLGCDDYKYLWLDYNTTNYIGNATISYTIPINTLSLISTNCNNSTISFYRNNSLTNTASLVAPIDFQSIGYRDYSSSQTKFISELVVYKLNQASNLSNINTNINSYYSIY
jgi:hypothetical protein